MKNTGVMGGSGSGMGEQWIVLAEYREKWWALVDLVMNRQFP
jgi:hypothetical protein